MIHLLIYVNVTFKSYLVLCKGFNAMDSGAGNTLLNRHALMCPITDTQRVPPARMI